MRIEPNFTLERAVHVDEVADLALQLSPFRVRVFAYVVYGEYRNVH